MNPVLIEQLPLFPEEIVEIGCLTVKYNPFFPDDVRWVNDMIQDEIELSLLREDAL